MIFPGSQLTLLPSPSASPLPELLSASHVSYAPINGPSSPTSVIANMANMTSLHVNFSVKFLGCQLQALRSVDISAEEMEARRHIALLHDNNHIYTYTHSQACVYLYI